MLRFFPFPLPLPILRSFFLFLLLLLLFPVPARAEFESIDSSNLDFLHEDTYQMALDVHYIHQQLSDMLSYQYNMVGYLYSIDQGTAGVADTVSDISGILTNFSEYYVAASNAEFERLGQILTAIESIPTPPPAPTPGPTPEPLLGTLLSINASIQNIATPVPLLEPVQALVSMAPLQVQAIQDASNSVSAQIYQSQQAVTGEIYGSSEMVRSQVQHAEVEAGENHRKGGGFLAEFARFVIGLLGYALLWVAQLISVCVCWLLSQVAGFLPTVSADALVVPAAIIPYLNFFFPVDVFAKSAVLLTSAYGVLWVWGLVSKWVATL